MTVRIYSNRANHVDLKESPLICPALASCRGQLSPIDLAHLDRITCGNKELQRDLLQLLAVQLVETLALLQKQSPESCVMRVVHTLKGTGRTMGIQSIWHAAEAVEGATDVSRATQIQKLREVIEATTIILEQMGLAPVPARGGGSLDQSVGEAVDQPERSDVATNKGA